MLPFSNFSNKISLGKVLTLLPLFALFDEIKINDLKIMEIRKSKF